MGTFTDPRDNKTYKWVKIGDQVWMAENLAYTGPDIQHITDCTEWSNNDDYDGWCYYNNDQTLGQKYGPLYQWEAAKTAVPPGWHLPTADEWEELFTYLQDNDYGVNGGDGIAISMAIRDDWEHINGFGVIGSGDFTELENKSGFSALPAGVVSGDSCQYLHQATFWWSSTETSSVLHTVVGFGLSYDWFSRFRWAHYAGSGLSVRCVKD